MRTDGPGCSHIFDRCQCRRARIVVSSMVEYSSWSGEQSAARRCDRLATAAEEVEARSVGCRGGFPGSRLTAKFLVGHDADWSGCFGARFDEGEPLVAEVGDYLQAAAEGFDVGRQGA